MLSFYCIAEYYVAVSTYVSVGNKKKLN